MIQSSEEISAIVRACFQCYVEKDRAKIETLISDDFHFTSPLDNRINRQSYFERCWPNSETMAAIDIERVVVSSDRAFVTYDLRMKDRKQFRNTELITVQNGKVTDVEVYFGWSTPHEAPAGQFVTTNTKSKDKQ